MSQPQNWPLREKFNRGRGLAAPVKQATKRVIAAALLLVPALAVSAVFVLAPKADTPREEPLPDGPLTVIAFSNVTDGDARHAASGNMTLYHNGTGHLLYFQGYDARSGPNVWFFLVPDARARSSDAVEGDGIMLRVPGPGQATYRGDFVVPIPLGTNVEDYEAVIAWDRTLNVRFAVASWA